VPVAALAPAVRLRPWRGLLALLAAVLLAHALLLALLPVGAGDPARGAGRRSPTLRLIVVPPPVSPAAAPPAVAPAPAPMQMPRPRIAGATAIGTREPASPPAPAPGPAAAEAAPAPPPEADVNPVPVYATRLPPPARLRYELRRGALVGIGDLLWRPEAGHYTLTLDGSAISPAAAGWASEGGFDAAGIAPVRYVDRRRGRDVRAANFRRESGRITYSGPQVQYPLWPGAQDRLSWMLQLPAIVAADPAQFVPGARITMFVTGARGDGDLWTFAVEAVEALELPIGRVDGALHLRREPSRPYDSQVEVWLDPARAHLPVRLRLSVAPSGETTDFLLSEHLPL
jgi:hypothetical protein